MTAATVTRSRCGRRAGAYGTLVDAWPTWELIEQLLAVGVTHKRIGQAVTDSPNTTALHISRDRITLASAWRVEALHYDAVGDPDDPPRADTRKFALDELVAAGARLGLVPSTVIKMAGLNASRAKAIGLNAEQADRGAVALGLHPFQVWAEWYEWPS